MLGKNLMDKLSFKNFKKKCFHLLGTFFNDYAKRARTANTGLF